MFTAIPAVSAILNSVSTDDAYVNGHVTFVAARVPGQVTKVWVDDNDRVNKGSILVQLDKEPYQIQVALKKAAFETAEAQLLATEDSVRGQVAQVRGNRFKLQHAIESVDNQIALLAGQCRGARDQAGEPDAGQSRLRSRDRTVKRRRAQLLRRRSISGARHSPSRKPKSYKLKRPSIKSAWGSGFRPNRRKART